MWIFIGIVVIYVLYKFLTAVNADSQDLAVNPIETRFSHLYKEVNKAAFNNQASLDKLDKNKVVLFKNGANQMIVFEYMMKNLYVKWHYKYMQKELIYEEQFNSVQNISVYDQEKIAKNLISTMKSKVAGHVSSIESGVSFDDRRNVIENATGVSKNPLNFSLDEKLAAFVLLLTLSNIDNDMDPREMMQINSCRQLLDIDDSTLAIIQAKAESDDYSPKKAFSLVSTMDKKKRDILLVLLNDLAAADDFIHENEIDFMEAYAHQCGYSSEEAEQVVDKYKKVLAMMMS